MPLNGYEKHLFSEKWTEAVKNFDCNSLKHSNFETLNVFLKENALRHHKDNFSRTNIYVENGVCIAYYSLSMNTIKEEKIEVEKEYESLVSYPALFLTRFAIDRNHQNTGIGKAIINEIIKKAYKDQEVASRFLFVDAYPESVSWYLGNPLFTILYSSLAQRIEKCIEKKIINKLNVRLKQGHVIDCKIKKDVHADTIKKNCEYILNTHIDDIFMELTSENSLFEECHSKVKLIFEDNRPQIELENFNVRANFEVIRGWLKEKENILNLDITIPLYLDINKYYFVIYGR